VAVHEFDNDDEGYIRWRHDPENWDGFIVAMLASRKPEDTCLHRAHCEILDRPVTANQALTANPKVCSTIRAELRPYWRGGSMCSRVRPRRVDASAVIDRLDGTAAEVNLQKGPPGPAPLRSRGPTGYRTERSSGHLREDTALDQAVRDLTRGHTGIS
jgi:hypothetical protein